MQEFLSIISMISASSVTGVSGCQSHCYKRADKDTIGQRQIRYGSSPSPSHYQNRDKVAHCGVDLCFAGWQFRPAANRLLCGDVAAFAASLSFTLVKSANRLDSPSCP